MNSRLLPDPSRLGQRRLRPLWVLLMLLLCWSMTARGAQEGDFQFQTDGARVEITGYTGPGGEVVIPDRIGGNPVTIIGFSAFRGVTNLTSVAIPASVTLIGNFAFSGCASLTGVTIPNSVTSIGVVAFSYCTSLRGVSIPISVTSIGEQAFFRCRSLMNVTIPDNVTSLGEGAFFGCAGLTNVTIGNSVTSIGDVAFSGCTGLMSVAIPNGVTNIGNGTFDGCTSLTSVSIPGSVKSIADYLFQGCTRLTNLTIPTSVTNIGYAAFYICTALPSVIIPNSVAKIGDYAFSRCSALANVTIGKSVTSMGSYAFQRCTGLKSIEVDALNPAYNSEGGVLFNKARSVLLLYPPLGKAGAYTIPNGVANIGGLAFSGCTALTSITIPNSVSSIGHFSFSGCTRLTGVYFEGNAPALLGAFWFEGSPFVTVFYRFGTIGWGATFAGRPTAIWAMRPIYANWAMTTGLAAQFPAASGEADDADGDGFNNGDEWFAGTDPTQRASRLELELMPRPGDLSASDQTPIEAGQHAVYFRSVAGRYYGVQRATVLGGPWELQAVRIAVTTQTRFVLPQPDEHAFYRVLALP